MLRLRVVFLGTRGALNPERYQAAVLVESAGTRVLLDTGGGLGRVRRPACVNSPSSTCRGGARAYWCGRQDSNLQVLSDSAF
jgi:hypothetical protein